MTNWKLQQIARQIRNLLLIVFVIGVFSGCSNQPITTCPPLVIYDDEQKDRLLSELEALEPDSILVDINADYLVLREQVELCRQK